MKKPLLPESRTLLLACLCLLALSSCYGPPARPKAVAGNTVPKGWWHGEGVQGSRKIVIDLSKQQIRYFKGGQLVGASPISSGSETHPTMTGSFHVMDKDIDHRSSLYGAFCDNNRQIVVPDVDSSQDTAPAGTHFIGAEMPYFMRIKGGVGMHEGYLPGYPASHGCIRLPGEMAAIFYEETPIGTPVEIIGDAAVAVIHDKSLPPEPGKAKSQPAATGQNGKVQAAATRKPGPPVREQAFWWHWNSNRLAKPAPQPFGSTQYLY